MPKVVRFLGVPRATPQCLLLTRRVSDGKPEQQGRERAAK